MTVLEAGFWLSPDNFPGPETRRFVKLFPVKKKISLLIFRKGISSEIKDMETQTYFFKCYCPLLNNERNKKYQKTLNQALTVTLYSTQIASASLLHVPSSGHQEQNLLTPLQSEHLKWGHVRSGVTWEVGSREKWGHVRSGVTWEVGSREKWGHVRSGVTWDGEKWGQF